MGSIATYSTSSAVLRSDFNVVVNRFSTNGAKNNKTITSNDWKVLGQDLHSWLAPANLDQLFVNPADNDYHIEIGSDAHQHGTPLTEVANDFDGQTRPGGLACDIGADEIVSMSALATGSPASQFTNDDAGDD